MAGKGNKKRNSKDSTKAKDKPKPKKRKNGHSGGGSGTSKSSKFHGDIFNDGAMENAYLVCHNVQVGRLPKNRFLFSTKLLLFRNYTLNLPHHDDVSGCVESSRLSMARSKEEKRQTKVNNYKKNSKKK